MVRPQQGYNTGNFGSWLTSYISGSPAYQGCQVYYDHGDASENSNVVATKGFLGAEVTNLNRLADIDAMVVTPDGNARVLIEIEEKHSSPKKVLGDVLAVLICNRFAVRPKGIQHYFGVTGQTDFIVAGVVPASGHRLEKIQKVILPRVRQIRRLSDGISPERVDMVFSDNIEATIEKLKALIVRLFPS